MNPWYTSEIYPKERRVAMVPAVIPNLKKAGLEVLVEAGAGHAAGYPDKEYVEKGAKLAADRAEVFRTADIIVQFLCHGANDQNGNVDLPLFRKGQVLMGFLRPLGTAKTLQEIAERGVTSLAVDTHCRASPRAKHGRALFDGGQFAATKQFCWQRIRFRECARC